MRTNSSDAYIQRLGEDISELVMGIFEHSNFQDITGQRITKVVNTLKFVEDRIDKMINIWGQETIDELLSEMPETQHGEDDERRLLNGPQMEDEAISKVTLINSSAELYLLLFWKAWGPLVLYLSCVYISYLPPPPQNLAKKHHQDMAPTSGVHSRTSPFTSATSFPSTGGVSGAERPKGARPKARATY